jgi:hypothetical protein
MCQQIAFAEKRDDYSENETIQQLFTETHDLFTKFKHALEVLHLTSERQQQSCEHISEKVKEGGEYVAERCKKCKLVILLGCNAICRKCGGRMQETYRFMNMTDYSCDDCGHQEKYW